MKMICKTQLLARLGRDADLVIIDNNAKNQVVRFTVCYTRKFIASDGNQREEITWYDCSFWFPADANASVWKYLKKGDLVLMDGVVGASAFIDRKGEAVAALTFRVKELFLLPNGHIN